MKIKAAFDEHGFMTIKGRAKRFAKIVGEKEAGYTEVSIPRKVIVVEKIPLLGSGKTDYPAVARLVA